MSRRPVAGPDPDSLAMDDRGTRPFRSKSYETEEALRSQPGSEVEPEEHWLPASDAPTIIRDVQR